jgi:hypothetical protein
LGILSDPVKSNAIMTFDVLVLYAVTVHGSKLED